MCAIAISGPLINRITGIIGELQFSNCRWLDGKKHTLQKRTAVRKNRRTKEQQEARAAFAELSRSWRDLTPEEKAAWQTYVKFKGIKKQEDANGTSPNCPESGYNVYMGINSVLKSCGMTPVRKPPGLKLLEPYIRNVTAVWDPILKVIRLDWNFKFPGLSVVQVFVHGSSKVLYPQIAGQAPLAGGSTDISNITPRGGSPIPLHELPGTYRVGVRVVDTDGRIGGGPGNIVVIIP